MAKSTKTASKREVTEVEVHAEVLPAVYIHFTDPQYQHVYISGFDLKDALENANRWRYYQRRDNHIDPVIILDNVTDGEL